MAHHHSHTFQNIRFAFTLNLIFTIIEIVGGIYTNSVAILSDALHDLGDSISLGISWFLETYSKKKRDKRYTYGYARFSLLAAFLNGLVLIIGSFIILREAIPRLVSPEQPNARGMLLLAILGVVFNGAAVFRLRKGRSQNEKVITWHLMEDVFGWLTVLIGSVVMLFADLPIVDAIISVLFTMFILYNVVKNFIHTVRIFLQAKPEGVNLLEVESAITSLMNVNSTHDLHIWSMDGASCVLTVHVVVDDNLPSHKVMEVKKDIRGLCHDAQVDHITVEVEYESEKCELENC